MICDNLFKDEPTVEEKKKNENNDEDESKDYLIYHELSPKTLKDCLARIKSRPKKQQFKCILKQHKLYYQPGIVAKIDTNTTDNDLCKLLRQGVRTLLVQTAFATPEELEQIMLKINTAIDNFKMEMPYNTPIGLAVEMKSELIRTGRLRNQKPQEIEVGRLLVLTSNEDYRFVSLKEVIYVYNLWKYMSSLKINDVILLNNNKITVRIVKILNKNITVCVEKGEYVESYMDVVLPYCLTTAFEPSNDDFEDIDFAVNNNAHFLVIPQIKSYCWLKQFKKYLETFSENIEIAGYILNKCLVLNSCELTEIIKLCDVIWIPDLFNKKHKPLRFTVKDNIKRFIKLVQRLGKPIVAGIPIKSRKDFNKLENHEILKNIDSMLIEKSAVTKTYPIIAKNLQPIPKDCCKGQADPIYKKGYTLSPQEGLVNCTNYILQSIPCQGIVITSSINQQVLKYLSAADIYCPVIAVVNNERTAKNLNILRNIKSVVYTCERTYDILEDECIKHGMSYGRDLRIFWPGDFVVTFYDMIYRGCVAAKIRAVYVPKERIIVKQSRLNY